jgi:hypothetical protein
MVASEEEVKEIKRRHAARLLQEPGVCGIGVEKDKAGRYFTWVFLFQRCPTKVPTHYTTSYTMCVISSTCEFCARHLNGSAKVVSQKWKANIKYFNSGLFG